MISLWSILFTPTIKFLIPKVKANKACSLVYPSDEIPASNSDGAADMIKIATSAYEVPVIIFLIKSLCPGASMMVQLYLSVLNLLRAMLIVIPLALSDLSLSKTQA